MSFILASSDPWFNIKMPSHQYRDSLCRVKTILRPSYLHNGTSYTERQHPYIKSGPRSSAVMVLVIQDNHIIVFHEGGLNYLYYLCDEEKKTTKLYFMFREITSAGRRLRYLVLIHGIKNMFSKLVYNAAHPGFYFNRNGLHKGRSVYVICVVVWHLL